MSRLLLAAALLAGLLALGPPHILRAQTAPPDTIFGSVTVDGANAAAGTPVSALAMGETCDSEPYGGTLYSITLDPAKGACWQPFAQIRFLVAGRYADQTIRPQQLVGTRQRLDLTVGTTPTGLAPAAAAVPAGSTAIALTTASGLRAVGLQQSDLAGYTPAGEDTSSDGTAVAQYAGFWGNTNPDIPHLTVVDVVRYEFSVSAASDWLQITAPSLQQDPSNSNIRTLPPQGLGDEEVEVYYQHTTADGTPFDDYQFAFRRGVVTVVLDVADPLGTGSLARVKALAQIIDARLLAALAAQPTPAATGSPVPAPTVAPSGGSAGGCGRRGGPGYRLPSGKCA